MRIVLSGMVAGDPRQGGASWAVLQYVLGLRDLGHDVMLVEPVAQLDDETVRYFRREVVERFDLFGRAALVVESARRTVGPGYGKLAGFARDADLVLNISGMLRDEALRGGGFQVYVDLDPAFNQLWHAMEGVDTGLDGHDRYVTVGLAIGSPSCAVPTCDRVWITTLPPVVLDRWPPGGPVVHDALTTVGQWRSYGSIEHRGVRYGQKAHSVRELIALPERAVKPLRVAFAIHPDETSDIEALARHGWDLIPPASVAGNPAAYAGFVRGSWAEIGIAKSGYVHSRCGWFSDRSACYLASGRPVVAQDTGFGDSLPIGDGLLSFSGVESATVAIDSLATDYARHARAARALAEDVLDARLVLTRLLDEIGAHR